MSNLVYNIPSNFAYPGSSDPTGYGTGGTPYPSWSKDNSPVAPADNKSIGSMGPVTLWAGSVQKIDVAYVFAQDNSTTGVQAGKNLFLQYVDQIKSMYTNGTLNCTPIITNIAQKNNENDLMLYPNPVIDKVYLKGLTNENIRCIKLFTITGELVKEYHSKDKVLELNNLETGIYFLTIVTNNNRLVRKLIKK